MRDFSITKSNQPGVVVDVWAGGGHIGDKSPDFGLFFVQLVREGVPLGLFLVCFFIKIRSVFGLILDFFSPDF